MNVVALGGVLVFIYAVERGTALWRRVTLERRRGKADYPISANDPVGRTLV